jgi:hypothetical protein
MGGNVDGYGPILSPKLMVKDRLTSFDGKTWFEPRGMHLSMVLALKALRASRAIVRYRDGSGGSCAVTVDLGGIDEAHRLLAAKVAALSKGG